jgi:hypothetical protein
VVDVKAYLCLTLERQNNRWAAQRLGYLVNEYRDRAMKFSAKQKKALESGKAIAVSVNGTDCVLLRRDVYERARPPVEYDDSDWTTEEIDVLAAEAVQHLDEMPEIQ